MLLLFLDGVRCVLHVVISSSAYLPFPEFGSYSDSKQSHSAKNIKEPPHPPSRVILLKHGRLSLIPMLLLVVRFFAASALV